VRIRGREWAAGVACDSSRDAVSKTDCSSRTVVVASTEKTSRLAQLIVDGRWGFEIELGEVENCFLFDDADDPDEMVENLGNPDGGQGGVSCLDEKLDRCGGGFALEQCQHGVRVEDGHLVLRASIRASSFRPVRRASVVLGPRPRYLPTIAFTGSSGNGRSTMRLPMSTTKTLSACHRDLVSAGIDTCPFEETFIT